MKRIWLIVAVALILVLSPLCIVLSESESVEEKEFSSQIDEVTFWFRTDSEYKYTLLEDGTIRIDKYARGDMMKDPGLVANVDGKTVSIIGDRAFSPDAEYHSNEASLKMEEAIIPDCVESIGNCAFEKCEFQTVVIPDSVTHIGDNPFISCKKLVSIILSGNNSNYEVLEENVIFDKQKNMVICYPCANEALQYSVPERTEHIGNYAFYEARLESISLPEGVISIGDGAFSKCKSIRTLIIPESVRQIGIGAFASSGLYEIKIPNGITTISKKAFYHCPLKQVEISDGVIEIEDEAFNGCFNLEEIIIPNSVKMIGNAAFSGCERLTSITIPDSVIFIGENPFSQCTRLAEINVSSENPYWETVNGVLIGKNQRILITVPVGLSLSKYTVPEDIRVIGNYAFQDNVYLREVIISDGVQSIGEGAFFGCNGLYSVVIPSSVTTIGDGAFSGCESLYRITIPDGITEIGLETFSDCTELVGVQLPESITRIGKEAFAGCYNLKSIILPEKLESIGDYAFYECMELETVNIPGAVTHIGKLAFPGRGDALTFIVEKDSYGMEYCIEHNLKYRFAENNP